MKSTSLVSVITIFLNAERFIEEAIQSVLAQSYDHWELLLVDDGSSDSSSAIARRFALLYPDKLRYLAHPGHLNRGMSASRNLGLSAARGDFIAFLDADDVWLPDKLTEQLAILLAHPQAAMVYGRTQKWFGWTGNPEDVQKDSLTLLAAEPDTLVDPPVLLTRFLKNEHIYPCTCSMMVRRQVFDQIGKFEESFRDAYEDMVFHSKVFLNAPVFVSGECWDRYRRHPDNSWKRAAKAGLYDPLNPNPLRRTYLTWVESYLADQGITDGEVWRALQEELWPYRNPVSYRLSKFAGEMARDGKEYLRSLARRVLPAPARQWVRSQSSTDKTHE